MKISPHHETVSLLLSKWQMASSMQTAIHPNEECYLQQKAEMVLVISLGHFCILLQSADWLSHGGPERT